MTKKRSWPALAANLRRADKAGKSKKDLEEEWEADWRAHAFCNMDGDKDGSCTHCGALPDEECRG